MRSEGLRNLACSVLLSLAVATVLAGCINADPNSAVAPPAEPVTLAPPAEPETSAPATGQPDITPDKSGDGNEPKPAVSLPRLPVGGNGEFVDEAQNLQCANVSWIVEQGGPGELRSGIRIVITGFQFDEHSFRFTRHGCEDVAPSCVGYTFTSESGSPACALAIRTRRPLKQAPDPQLGIAGTIECVDISLSTCRDFVQAAAENRGSVELAIPWLDPTDDGHPTAGSSDPSPTSDEESPGNSDS